MLTLRNYTPPRLVKGVKPNVIPKGSTLDKEWAKNNWYVNYSFNGKQYRIKDHKEKAFHGEALLLSVKNDLKRGYDPVNPELFIQHMLRSSITIEEAVSLYTDELKRYIPTETVESIDGTFQAFFQWCVKNNYLVGVKA
jgi:hypothetical protein